MKNIKFRRKREGRTNYKKRLTLLRSGLHRLIIRVTNTQLIVQLVNFHPDGDKVLFTVSGKDVCATGWKHSCKNLPGAYITGLLAAKKAKTIKVSKAVVDIGFHTPRKGSRVYAAVKGVMDGGLDVNASEKIFPSKERLSGKHINDFVVKDFNVIIKKLVENGSKEK